MSPIICLDVDYRASSSVAAAVVFHDWSDAASSHEVVHRADAPPADYQPGQFYLRELPHLLAVLELATRSWSEPPRLLLVDGFVWLEDAPAAPASDEGALPTPGLGAHLHRALADRGHAVPVIGVAKRPYRLANRAVPVVRGQSAAPLWVTAVGVSVEEAAAAVAAMHGEHRLPTLLKRVDRLARDS